MKNKIFFWLVFLFALLNIADSITALFILPGESNPMFIWLGSIWPVICLKAALSALAFWMWWKNEYPSNALYFFTLSVFVFSNIMLCVGVASNVYGMLTTSYVQYVSEISTTVKVTYYTKLVGLLYVVPVLICNLIFKFYEWSIGVTVIKKGDAK